MDNLEQMAWDRLRSMKDPGSRRDIVSLGLAKDIKLTGRLLTVHLTPPSGDAYRHEALATAIRRELGPLEGIDRVIVTWAKPRPGNGENGSLARSPPASADSHRCCQPGV